MAQKNDAQLTAEAIVIRDEVVPAANTTERVYEVLKDIIDSKVNNENALPTFANDIVVSLADGKTLGKFTNGQIIPSAGKNAEQVLNLIAKEDIYPTYTIPTLSLAQSAPTVGEVGTAVTNTLTATFTQNDAGALTAISIKKNGAVVGSAGSTSPEVENDNHVRIEGTNIYQAFASYGAGPKKKIQPGNTVDDDRTPQVRDTSAPQAADTDMPSNTTQDTGIIPWFWFVQATDALPSSAAVYGSNKVIALSNGDITVPFTGAPGFLGFAVPAGTDFATWYQNELNQGAIGGASNLFKSPQTVSVTSTGLASNYTRDFDVYITNYATEPVTLIMQH